MEEFTARDYDLIVSTLKGEWIVLRNIMNDLTRRGLHSGNQQVAIQLRMEEVSTLIRKIHMMRRGI